MDADMTSTSPTSTTVAPTATRDELHRRWRAGEAPDGDFIVFADGTLLAMELQVRRATVRGNGEPNDERAEEWHWNQLLRATEWSPTGWVDVEGCISSATHGGSRALVGESCSHGSIGYVALTRESNGGLEWLAISATSNPFTKVSLDEDALTAVSTAGQVWTFPRHAPQHVRITADPDHAWSSAPPAQVS